MTDQSEQTKVGKYTVLQIIGRGAMGVVYKAQDPEIGRLVAIKMLNPLPPSKEDLAKLIYEHFRLEAKSAGNLRHPNIITIFDVNIHKDSPYIVMDYVEGETLEQQIERLQRLSPPQVINYLYQLAAGLDYAHAHGVIHRDVKPANILIDYTEHLFILDFGVASFGDFADKESEPIMGTPSYMSPEQILNKTVDYQTDLFSLGIVAFEAFTGKRPFAGNSATTVLGNILKGIRYDLTEVAPDLPLSLEAEFDRAFAPNREERFSSGAEMVAAFEMALSFSGGSRTNVPGYHPSATAARDTDFDVVTPLGIDLTATDEYKQELRRQEHRELKKLEREEQEKRKKFLLGIGLLMIGVGLLLLWFLLAPHQKQGGITSEQLNSEMLLLFEFSTEEKFQSVKFAPIPANKAISEMSDAELLGIITSKNAVEARIIEALREGLKRHVATLMEATFVPLENDSYVVRQEALKTLVELKDKKAVRKIVPHLDDYDPIVRKEAARTLGVLGDRRALGYLHARLIKEQLKYIQVEIAKSLEEIKETVILNQR